MFMSEVYKILKQLEATSSKNEKEAILVNNKDNKVLKECFRLAYSPTIQFYQKQLPEDIDAPFPKIYTLEEGLEDLKQLYNRIYTGSGAKIWLQDILSILTPEDNKVLKRVVLKDLRCGVGDTTVNKVWKGLIPKVPQMLASAMKEKSLSKIEFPALAQLKSDGSRCIAYCSTDGVRLMSRNGKQYIGLTDLEKSLSHKEFDGFVIDGELVFDTTKADRSTGNGIITKAVKGTISEQEQSNVIFQVWDMIPQNCYVEKGRYSVAEEIRYNTLHMAVELSSTVNVQMIPCHVVGNMQAAKELFQDYVSKGYEGIILKNKYTPWEDKRSPNLVKFKEELFADLLVSGFYEGEGKYEDMLGGLSLESTDGIINVNVGSGFTDDQRTELWKNRDDLLDKIVEVKYNGVVVDKRTGVRSLFLPIFQRIREDKSDANNYEDMQ